LPIAARDRAALNDPKLEADTPSKAYVPNGRASSAGAPTGTGRPAGKYRAAVKENEP